MPDSTEKTILQNHQRVYDLIDTPAFQLISPFAFGFKKGIGMQEAIFVVKAALQRNSMLKEITIHGICGYRSSI